MMHESFSPYLKEPCRIAEALVAGRAAGRQADTSAIDCPFPPGERGDERCAWLRGFAVGRLIDPDEA